MIKSKKTFLILSILAFAIGFSDLQENVFFWMGRPIGAIFFGLYLIFMVLEKESVLYDEQNQYAPGKETALSARVKKNNCQEVAATPALTAARSH